MWQLGMRETTTKTAADNTHENESNIRNTKTTTKTATDNTHENKNKIRNTKTTTKTTTLSYTNNT